MKYNPIPGYQRVLLVDDHQIVRYGVSQMLLHGFPELLIRESPTLFEISAQLESFQPDLIITDLKFTGFPVMESISAIRQLADRYPMVVFSMYPSDLTASYLTHQGVLATLCKADGMERLIKTLSEIFSGVWKKPSLDTSGQGTFGAFTTLSAREMEVARCIGRGKSNHEICEVLGVKPSTVSTYKLRIYEKLRVENDADIVRLYEFIPFKKDVE